MQYKDYYETLGVPKTASQDEIRKSFRKLARQYHPDVAKEKKVSEGKFKEINEAYEVLGDAEKRKQYDELGSSWQPGSAPGSASSGGGGGRRGGDPFAGGQFGGTGFSDFFEQFFGGAAGAGRARDPFGRGAGFPGAQPEGGADVEADLLVTIEEALQGAKKKISFQREGSPKVETFEVRIPAGVRAGQRIRLAGQGDAPPSGGKAGDLYLRVKFAQHPDYRVEGGDLIYEVEVPVARVVLGTECEVPTPEGAVRLKIPPGSRSGRKFRLRGRGLPTGPGARGDLLAELSVILPESISTEERLHWEALAKLSSG